MTIAILQNGVTISNGIMIKIAPPKIRQINGSEKSVERDERAKRIGEMIKGRIETIITLGKYFLEFIQSFFKSILLTPPLFTALIKITSAIAYKYKIAIKIMVISNKMGTRTGSSSCLICKMTFITISPLI